MYQCSNKGDIKFNCVNKKIYQIPNLAYFGHLDSFSVNVNEPIPIKENLILGKEIALSTPISIQLNNGVYDISFSLVCKPSENGISSATLFAGSYPTNISSSTSSLTNTYYSLSARGIYVSTNNSEQLSLINTSTSTQEPYSLNLVIKKIS